MRLTLRTLLAYMDDILDPADKEELAKKIESSSFAEDLIYRTQDTMRRLRLSAPQVIGTGMALDPNTVSEYLDNVLPPESVGDFERICLESPMHLAEVASSHHVLTMVLGEPADIDPIVRERMHALLQTLAGRKQLRIEPAHGTPQTADKDESDAEAETPIKKSAEVAKAPSKAELPEYLRTSVWSRHHVALTAVAAILLVTVIGVLVAQTFQGETSTVAQVAPDETLASPEIVDASSAGEPSVIGSAIGNGSATPVETDVASTSTEDETHGDAGSTTPSTSDEALIPQVTGGDAEPTVDAATSTPAAVVDNAGGEAAPSADTASTADATTAPGGEVALSVPTVSDSITPEEPRAEAAAGAFPETDDVRVASSMPVADDASSGFEDTVGQAGDVAEPAVEPIVDMGTFLGGKVVLLRYNDQAGAWFRLASRSQVANGDKLLSLPAFRPEITLTSGVHVDLSGGSQIVVRTADEAEIDGLTGVDTTTSTIEVVYGRVVLINTANEDNQIVLKMGSALAGARLARGATLAVEVERAYVPGQDPRVNPSPLVARLYAPEGGVNWQVGESETAIREPARWTIADGVVSPITADSQPPEWIDQEPAAQRSEQLYGAPVIEDSLNVVQPADIQLLELFMTGRRREVKSLATRSSVHVGLFLPFIEALRDSDQRSNWRTQIELLRSAMALSPESATRVWEALVAQRGEKAAADLYEMLCGYNLDQIGHTPEEMQTGALARLIDWLEDDNLDYRVLAVQNLRELTGKNLLSNPAGSLSERAVGVRRWRDRLESGELMPPASDARETR